EVTGASDALAAIEDFAPFLRDALECGEHLVYRAAIDERTHQRAALDGIANADVRVGGLEACHHLTGDSFLQDEAPRARAALTGGADGAEEHGAHSKVDVRVIEHDDGVVAAEFEKRAAEPLADDD